MEEHSFTPDERALLDKATRVKATAWDARRLLARMRESGADAEIVRAVEQASARAEADAERLDAQVQPILSRAARREGPPELFGLLDALGVTDDVGDIARDN